MASVVENLSQLPAMLAAPGAIALVSVEWSPWPQKSRFVLAALEQTREKWFPGNSVEFFDVFPERDDRLNEWYEGLFKQYFPRFKLHGDGYGPLWWLAGGVVVDCLTKPYEQELEALQKRSAELFSRSRSNTPR